jgi:hypothetical protein
MSPPCFLVVKRGNRAKTGHWIWWKVELVGYSGSSRYHNLTSVHWPLERDNIDPQLYLLSLTQGRVLLMSFAMNHLSGLGPLAHQLLFHPALNWLPFIEFNKLNFAKWNSQDAYNYSLRFLSTPPMATPLTMPLQISTMTPYYMASWCNGLSKPSASTLSMHCLNTFNAPFCWLHQRPSQHPLSLAPITIPDYPRRTHTLPKHHPACTAISLPHLGRHHQWLRAGPKFDLYIAWMPATTLTAFHQHSGQNEIRSFCTRLWWPLFRTQI